MRKILFVILLSFSLAPVCESAYQAPGSFAYWIHGSSYRNQESAHRDLKKCQAKGYRACMRKVDLAAEGIWFRVYIGGYTSKAQATRAARRLKEQKLIVFPAAIEELPRDSSLPSHKGPGLSSSRNHAHSFSRQEVPAEKEEKAGQEPTSDHEAAGWAASKQELLKAQEASSEIGKGVDAVRGSLATGALPDKASDSSTGNSLCDAAMLDFRAGRYERALDEFAEASRNARVRETAARRMADCCYFLGCSGRKQMLLNAVEQYKNLLKQYPDPQKENELARCRLAESYERLGFYYEALGAYDNLISLYPNSPYLQLAMWKGGEMQRRAGRLSLAVERYVVYVMKFPLGEFAKVASFAIGDCYYRMQQPMNAELWFRESGRKWPGIEGIPSDILLSLGYHHFQMGKFPEAVSVLAYYASLYPADTSTGIALSIVGQSFLRMNNPMQALKVFSNLMERNPETKEGTEATLMMARIGVMYPGLRVPVMMSGMDSYRDPLRTYDDILRRNPTDDLLETVLFQKGWALGKMGRLADSVDCILDELKLFPQGKQEQAGRKSIAEVAQLLVKDLYGKNDHVAVADVYFRTFGSGIVLDGDLVSLNTIASSLRKIGLYRAAGSVLEKMIKKCKDDECRTGVTVMMARIDRCRGKDADAELKLSLLTKGGELPREAKRIMAEVSLGKYLWERSAGLYKEYLASAGETEDTALVYRDYANALKGEGMLGPATGQYKNALQEYVRDRHRYPPSLMADAYIGIGECSYAAKNYPEGLMHYQQSLALIPAQERKVWTLYRMGQVYAKLRDLPSAEKMFAQVRTAGGGGFWSKLVDYCIEDNRWSEKNEEYLSQN